ncbi:Gfo/Idh/MocA family oxidoreductase [Microbacterium sp. STN6]|uniref:Gfo/Idh/MocA family protein n=1 Tax=Microbacterium sp. STN6 TaxID=2995588 RepID=UPI002260917A|nr:Gfo/Idh/MocA family oxidoreductase [Microbacterium sp. STN6]MCX7522826.1 Gfo/Idh/MocA family oxidoreductase [Microbacterium sp. STN6]
MSHPLGVAVLGFWHVHAADYAKSIERHPDTRLVAVWDDDEQRGRAGAKQFSTDFEADLDALLARDDVDAVTVTTATTAHRDIMVKAARAGKHIFTEKLLAPTVEECNEIIDEVARAGVALVVSLPRLYEAATQTIMRILADGSLGDLTYTRVRLAHDGWVHGWLPERFGEPSEAIGGALTDLGCHAVYLTRLFHGEAPTSILASYASVTGRAVEDNATVTAQFPGGGLGVFEASLVTTPGAYTLELRGTEGSLMFGFGSEKLLAKGSAFDPEAWSEVTLADAAPDAFSQWVTAIHDGSSTDENVAAAVELTRLVVASNASAASGRAISPDTAG